MQFVGFSLWWLLSLWSMGSVFGCAGLVAPQHVESSLEPVSPPLAGRFLTSVTTREVCVCICFNSFIYYFIFGCTEYLLPHGLFSSCGERVLPSSCGVPASHCGGFFCGSSALGHGLSCSAACGIFPDWGSNPCLLHWKADSLPLSHQGNLCLFFN